MVQLYVPNVSVVCCIQVFHVSEVERHGGHDPGAMGWGAVIRGLAFRACPLSILRMGRARPHSGSARIEIEKGDTRKERRARHFPRARGRC
jgi:hypothetical protein